MHQRFNLILYYLKNSELLIFCISYLFTLITLDNNSEYLFVIVLTLLLCLIALREYWNIFFIIIIAVLSSFFIYESFVFNKSEKFEKMIGQEISLRVKVIEDPVKVSDQTIRYVVKNELWGRLMVYAPIYPAYKAGTSVLVKGVIGVAPEFEDFSYKRYLETEAIFYILEDAEIEITENESKSIVDYLFDYRNSRIEFVQKTFAYPASAIVNGIVFGVRADFSEEFEEVLIKSGTMHIVAVSGANISILFNFLYLFNRFLNRKLFNIFSGLLLFLFCILIGFFNYSALRAVIFSWIILFSKNIGRRISMLNLISLSTLLIVIFNPFAYRSISFIFSLLAIIGASYFNDFIKYKTKLPDFLSSTFSISFLTGLFQVQLFGNFSFVGIIVNILLNPVISTLTLGGTIIVILSSINIYLADIFSLYLKPILSLFLALISIAAEDMDFLYVKGFGLNGVVINFVYIVLFIILINFSLVRIYKKLSRKE